MTALRDAFLQVLKSAGIERTSNSRIRLHDLRQHADSRIMQTLAT